MRSHLVTENKARDASDQLGQEHQRQEHGVLEMERARETCFGASFIVKCAPEAKLTSLSIHGLPRHVAKHPNNPNTMMVVPVPMST